jgi:hypothetical protein
MINFYNQVPSVYPNLSRDFQYLSWLINIVLNSVKHNVDGLYDLPNVKGDTRLAELLAMTLGFKVKRVYDQKQLAALVSIIPNILKYKGTKTAVILAGKALINAAGATGDFDCELKNGVLEVNLPKELIDVTLFMDLLPYILPAGTTCHITRKTVHETHYETDVYYYGDSIADVHEDFSWDESAQESVGLTGLFNVDNPNAKPNFAFYKEGIGGTPVLNAGLLDNTIIPVLDPARNPNINLKDED